ncbi:MAG: tetratricopeptide repeat protein [Planctomycetes bacterium]|nr:tetratricopeptide repeat protein [Planctomycetota bacterium]
MSDPGFPPHRAPQSGPANPSPPNAAPAPPVAPAPALAPASPPAAPSSPNLANSSPTLLDHPAFAPPRNFADADATQALVAPTSDVPPLQHSGTSPSPDRGPAPSVGAEAPRHPAPPAQLPLGQTFGRYTLLGEVGHGGMGQVYKARDNELRRVVALKLLLPDAAAKPEAVERFHREARAAARLRHPHIVQVHDVGSIAGRPYFTMDLIEGVGLDEARRTLTTRRFAEVLRDAAHALHAAHQAGIVHRDVKPANILLDAAGTAFVSDFGLAKEVAEGAARRGLTVEGQVLGTPHYMSPEQANGDADRIGPRSDVWSLGVILYEYLAGRKPFEGEGYLPIFVAILQSDPPTPSQVVATGMPERGGGGAEGHGGPGGSAGGPARGRPSSSSIRRRVPRDLETICLTCLEKQPARRYSSALALAEDLQRWLDGEPIRARPLSTGGRALRWLARRKALAAAAATVLVLAVALVTYVLQSSSQRARVEARAAVATEAQLHAQAELEAEGVLNRAEGLWRDAKSILYRTEIPLERYHEKLAAALALYDDAIRRAPHYGWIYESRARVRIQTHDLAGAEADLAKALERLGPQRGRAARRSLGRVLFERSIDVIYAFDPKGERRALAESQAWRVRALAELEASAGAIEWRGTEEEAESARRLVDGFTSWLRGDRARAIQLFREGVDKTSDEECAWGLSVVAPGAEKEEWREKALRLRPRFARALMERGMERLRKGDVAGAQADCEAAVRIEPASAAAWLNHGSVRVAAGDLPGAIEDFGKSIHLEARAAIAWYDRGSAKKDIRDFPGAVADLTEAIRLDPRYAGAFVNRALARKGLGDTPGTMADLGEAIRFDPQNVYARYNRGSLRRTLGDLPGALEDLDEAVRLDPSLYPAYGNRGIARQDSGDLDGAIADFTEVIRRAPRDPDGRARRGDALRAKGQFDAAIADYDEALRLEPRSKLALVGRGAARAERGNPRGALADFEAALRVDPKDANTWYNRGVARFDAGDVPGARADFDEAIRLAPRHSAAWANRGSARASTGDRKGAVSDYDESLRLQPRNPSALYNRGIAKTNLGDKAGALADYDESLRLDPNGALVHMNRGVLYLERGDVARALADQVEAVRLSPGSAAALHNRAHAREAGGDLEGAIADYEGALRLEVGDQAGYAAGTRAGLVGVLVKLGCSEAERAKAAVAGRAAGAAQGPAPAEDRHRLVDRAFEHLRRAIELGWRDANGLAGDPVVEALRGDARWAALLEAAGGH